MAPRLPALIALLVLLALPCAASAQAGGGSQPAGGGTGPLPVLSGIPIEFSCDATLPPDHPALRRYPGEDAIDLARADGRKQPAAFVGDALCEYLWTILEGAGAHPAPRDVRLPARGVLQATLNRMWIEGSRVVEQRIGSTIMPVSIPHWAVATAWKLTFSVEYSGDQAARSSESVLRFELSGAAEQDDYAPLRLDSLLRGAALDTFSDLPRVLADDGHLGDLLFAVVATPSGAPPQLGVDGPAADGFWQLLSTRAKQRHDAMAFYLASDQIARARRAELARWFLLNDPDVALRRDALGWLLQGEDTDPDAEFSAEMMEVLSWLTLRERSSRVRAEAVRVLGTRPGEQVRSLLIAASTDGDARVADRAMSGLRREPPPTAADLAATPDNPPMPLLAAWTSALDGRVSPTEPAAKTLVPLALALGGGASDSWLARWAVKGSVSAADQDWAVAAWSEMAATGSLRVRIHTLERLASLGSQTKVAKLIESRVKAETEPTVRVAAIRAISRFDRVGLDSLLIEASRAMDPEVRHAAVEALTQVPGSRVNDRLEALASDDPTGKVRKAARKVLRTRAKGALGRG